MEKRISAIVNSHVNEYKDQLNECVKKNSILLENDELIAIINNIKCINLSNEDFMKRKRVKSVVAQYMRCIAKRANGEQCSRKKRESCKYCGTHEKNRPHGEISDSVAPENNLTKIEVKLQEINGVLYYIDNNNNIYCTEDIVINKISPKIIGKYKFIDNKYVLVN